MLQEIIFEITCFYHRILAENRTIIGALNLKIKSKTSKEM
jgi:hypothetical protein